MKLPSTPMVPFVLREPLPSEPPKTRQTMLLVE
jgi:hypothetical protein